jgi:hypothetical protein
LRRLLQEPFHIELENDLSAILTLDTTLYLPHRKRYFLGKPQKMRAMLQIRWLELKVTAKCG